MFFEMLMLNYKPLDGYLIAVDISGVVSKIIDSGESFIKKMIKQIVINHHFLLYKTD